MAWELLLIALAGKWSPLLRPGRYTLQTHTCLTRKEHYFLAGLAAASGQTCTTAYQTAEATADLRGAVSAIQVCSVLLPGLLCACKADRLCWQPKSLAASCPAKQLG